MSIIAPGVSFIDLDFLGRPRTIASAILQGADGLAIVDPGPSTTLPALKRGLSQLGMSIGDVRQILLTHIHLDHAGATGTLVAENPAIRVLVHERGAPHVTDPAKLVASATRLYGTDMERLWGEVRPVPASALEPLKGGERINAGGRSWDVEYTPGHAVHHVSYFNADAGVAFVGDTAGIRIVPDGPVVPPTPPPDIDLESWRSSLDRIAARSPETLFLTHFGPCAPSAAHLAEMREELERYASFVRDLIARGCTDVDGSALFIEELQRRLRRRLPEGEAAAYEAAARFDLSWSGLARYWRKGGGQMGVR